ncbi:MAG: fumarylacetoacetate hydrolase family protein, partial [Methyloceanibacter sp.]
MKLVRFGEQGRERPGLVDPEGRLRDLSGVVADLAGEALGPESLNRIRALDLAALPLIQGSPRLGPPVGTVPKFLGIGLNYRDHAEETGMPIPEVPIVFAKASSCVSGPTDPVLAPKDWQRMDYEVELAVVTGSRTKNVAVDEALGYVAGYAICNDVSERSLQVGGAGEWIKAK